MIGFFVFFFQAEDGIRDLTVTGVQTCALPICHAEPRVRALVHATGGAVACFVECGTHFLSLLELGLETVEPALVAILPRREAEHGAERAEQAMRRRAGASAQRREARRRVRMRIDPVAHGPHQRDAWVRRPGFAGAAAPAGAEPRLLGHLGNREERDLLPTRLFARARRAAVDAGRAHRVHERPVVAGVAGQHGPPAALGRQIGNDSGTGVTLENLARPRAAIYPFLAGESVADGAWRQGSTERLCACRAVGPRRHAPSATSKGRLPKARRSRGPCRPPSPRNPRTAPGEAPRPCA